MAISSLASGATRWPKACEIHDERETECLIGTPLLADYLEEALDALGYSPEDYKIDRV